MLPSQAFAASSRKAVSPTSRVNGDDDDMVCEDETPTGSHIPQRTCYPREQTEMERTAGQKAMHDAEQRAAAQTKKGS